MSQTYIADYFYYLLLIYIYFLYIDSHTLMMLWRTFEETTDTFCAVLAFRLETYFQVTFVLRTDLVWYHFCLALQASQFLWSWSHLVHGLKEVFYPLCCDLIWSSWSLNSWKTSTVPFDTNLLHSEKICFGSRVFYWTQNQNILLVTHQ